MDFTNDKAFLLKFCSEILGYSDPQVVAKILKDGDAVLPFDHEHFANYVRILTRREPCPVCGGPTYIQEGWRFNFPGGAGICWRSQGHNVVWWMSGLLRITVPDIEEGKAVMVASGGLCEHEILMIDCHLCMLELGKLLMKGQ